MLLYQFENKKFECLSYQKKTLKLSNKLTFLLSLYWTTYGSCLTFIRLTVVLCALHEPNYNLKAIIVAIVMQLNNYYDLVSNCFIRFYKHILN